VVDSPRHEHGHVWINATQRFENVPETAWTFPIGGYLPAQKWLKNRKCRALSFEDIRHYARDREDPARDRSDHEGDHHGLGWITALAQRGHISGLVSRPSPISIRRLVFIDETGASTEMACLRGRAPPGARSRAAIPHGHWKTTTLVAALRLEGITAPMVIDGAMNGEAFRAYVRHMLAPTLQAGAIVVMENLPAHKVAGVREAIDAVGARLLYLPPYSPDFNPVEQALAKLKAFPRKAAARTLDALQTAIAAALDAFAPDECANYFTAFEVRTGMIEICSKVGTQ
jgi:transposase